MNGQKQQKSHMQGKRSFRDTAFLEIQQPFTFFGGDRDRALVVRGDSGNSTATSISCAGSHRKKRRWNVVLAVRGDSSITVDITFAFDITVDGHTRTEARYFTLSTLPDHILEQIHKAVEEFKLCDFLHPVLVEKVVLEHLMVEIKQSLHLVLDQVML
jgi:hypothetical protein